MPSLLLCPRTTDVQSLSRDLGIPDDCIRCDRGLTPRDLSPRVPYLLGACHDLGELSVCSMLRPQGPMLTELCFDFGGPSTLALAEITAELRNYGSRGLSGIGAGAGLYSSRIENFVEAMRKHQDNMLAYRRATHAGDLADAAETAAARSRLVQSGSELNRRFAAEIAISTQRLRPRQRTLMSDRRQMPEIVGRTRKAARLDVASYIEAGELVTLARSTRRIGPWLVAIDLGIRADDVFDDYNAGRDWQRAALTEVSGAVAGAGAGALLTGAAAQALSAIAVLTPAGWALIFGGVVLAGVIVGGSTAADRAANHAVGSVYDMFAKQQLPRS